MLLFPSAVTTAGINIAGGHTRIAHPAGAPSATARASATDSLTAPFIFQFPAINGVRCVVIALIPL
jgi:hypothetical protein